MSTWKNISFTFPNHYNAQYENDTSTFSVSIQISLVEAMSQLTSEENVSFSTVIFK